MTVSSLVARFAAPLLFLALAGWSLLPGGIDPDSWWHMRLGRTLLEGNGYLVGPEPLSFLSDGAFVDHSYLHGILLALAEGPLGLLGMTLVGALPYLLIFACGNLLLRQAAPGWSPVARVAVLGFITFAAAPVLYPRAGTWDPALGLLLLVLANSRLRYRDAAVPLVLAAWAALHGAGLPFAVVVLGAIGLGRLAARDVRGMLRLVGASLAGAALIAVLPGGLEAAIYPLSVLSSEDQRTYINEWGSIFTHFDMRVLPTFALLGAGVLGLALGGWRRVTVVGALLAIPLAIGVFSAYRWILLATFVAGPLLAPAAVAGFAARIGDDSRDFIRRLVTGTLAVVVLVIGGSNYVALLTGGNEKTIAANFPVRGAAVLRELPVCGNVYTPYAWGGYLSANALDQVGLYGEAGALEAGGVDLGAWMRAEGGERPVLPLLAAARIDRVIVESGYPIDVALANAGWIERFRADGESAIWDRPSSPCAAETR